MTQPMALIIEDDPKLAFIFAQALRSADFETETLPDGRTARDRLAEITPAVVVLDLHLPYLSGRELLYHIRADQRFVETRVILATADSVLAESLQEEADLVLLKPISPIQLRDLAKRLRPLDLVEM
ncbi:MAG: response regulator [Anaerolineae bacterium]|nr:response regulator [Anaerolineae bacterium]